MTELKASTLLAPLVLGDPYDFFRRLRENAPVWAVPGTDVVVSQALASAGGLMASGSGLAIGRPMKRRALSPMKS